MMSFIGKGADEQLLLRAVHLHKCFRRKFFWQQAEKDGQVFFVQFGEDLRQVDRLQIGEQRF